jgi:hypothetical protein
MNDSSHLEIHQGKLEEVYRDIVRLPEAIRLAPSRKVIEEGRICKIRTDSKTAYVIVRGVENYTVNGHTHGRCIHMDAVTRKKLEVIGRESARFELTPVRWFGELRWAWNATEIGYRVASRLAIIGLVLGVIALVVTLPQIVELTQQFMRWLIDP